MAAVSIKYLYLLIINVINLINSSNANIINSLFGELNNLGDLMNYKEHFPSLEDELAKFSLEDVKHQLELGSRNEDMKLNATHLMKKYGYETEIHHVTTEDGYMPSIYRIPGKGKAEPVLLVHGLLNSAADWLTIGCKVALPYLLADEGYDVWLMNARGTTKDASGHIKLCAEKDADQYWDFSWDEVGRYDLPAVVDYILDRTGHSKLKYVGHSQGTTSFFIFCSERPDYNDKISLMVALSPVAWMSHLLSPLVRLVAPFEEPLGSLILNALGVNKVDPANPLIEILTKIICGESTLATLICGNIVFMLSGFNYAQLNVTNMPVIFAHTPSEIALKQLLHYGQGINSGKFRRYDHGPMKNLEKYGTSDPPDYPVEKITAPVALFYRTKNSDWFSSQTDVEILRKKLKNVVDDYVVPYEKFCHTDYLWAKGARKLVYNRILKLFKKQKG